MTKGRKWVYGLSSVTVFVLALSFADKVSIRGYVQSNMWKYAGYAVMVLAATAIGVLLTPQQKHEEKGRLT